MIGLQTLKNYYQKPFRYEIQSVFSLTLQKLVTKTLALAYHVIYYRKLKKYRIQCKKIREEIINKKKSVFVFANGPSLSDIDFAKIKSMVDSGGFDLIAINSFLSKSINQITPTFAVFADNVHFTSGVNDTQYSKDIKVCRENAIRSFVPVQHVGTSNDLNIGYNALSDVFSSNTENLFKSPGYYGVTAFHALRIAKYLGYDKIYVCGFDNSYFKDFELGDDGRLIIRHRHYYDGNECNIEVPCLYSKTSEFFFDTYRHFYYLERIFKDKSFFNVAKKSYINTAQRKLDLDIYK